MDHPITSGTYQHYKGGLYEVIGVGQLHGTGEKLTPVVLYRSLKDAPDFPAGSLWARPLVEFMDEVEIDGKHIPRFIHVDKK